MQLKKGTTIANRYVIEGVLGTGGMAIVYKAQDIKLDRDVTLKVMREEYCKDDDFINRFNIEAKAAAKLNHQNIVNVYDVGKYGDIYFIVMEYIEGVTLKEIIKKKGTFTNEEILGVSIQIAQALEVAHRNDIVHRDIKPQNILITVKGDVKVTDFGIARAVNANTVTTGNNTMGSVHYFSPEQARGGYVDQKSDIYSLGITMYEMATGSVPFDDETVVAIALKHISEPLPNISEINPRIDETVIKIIDKATQKISTLRYDTIESMNDDLKRALINVGKNSSNEDVQNDEIPKMLDEQTHTKLLSEDDITEIRTRAMTAFFDDDEMEEIEMLSNDYDNFEDDYEPKNKNLPIIIGGVVTALILSGIIAFFVFKWIDGGSEYIEAPNFVGMEVDEALEIAKENNVIVSVKTKAYDDEVEEGFIISQQAGAGDPMLAGGTVEVTVSLGSDKKEVPDVTGLTTQKAFDELSELGFVTDYKYIYDEDVEKNHIIRQTPDGGSNGSDGDVITLYVSKGVETSSVTVPSLKGLSETEAKNKINASSLTYGTTTTEYSDQYEKGYVIKQSLEAGSEVSSNSRINLTISDGKKPSTEENTDTTNENKKTDTTTTTNTDTAKANTTANESSRVLTVNPINDMEETDNVSIRIIKISEDGDSEVAYEQTVQASNLPVNVAITGSGNERIQIYAKKNDGEYKLEATDEINFGE